MDLLNSYDSDRNDGDDGGDDGDQDVLDNDPARHGNAENETTSRRSVTTTSPKVQAKRGMVHPAPPVSLRTAANLMASSATSNQAALTLYNRDNSSSSTTTNTKQYKKGGEMILMNNPTKDVMYEPVYGPALDDMNGGAGTQKQNHPQPRPNIAFDETTFHEQRATFQRTGKALAPEGHEIVRTTLGYDPKRLQFFAKQEEERARKRPRPQGAGKDEEEEPLVYGSDDEVEFGIWAPPSHEERYATENALSDLAKGGVDALAPEQLAEREYIKERNRQRGLAEEQKEEESAFDRLVERKMSHLLPPRMESDQPVEASTTFHGKEEFDYKGQSWLAPPAGLGSLLADGDLGMNHHRCFVPKKCVHRFTGHNKGVHRIRLFPRTGHLILSAGLDGKCKVWSVQEKQVMRTYVGHAAAVRDVQFNHDGSRFVSASFDRFLRLWNTETGEVVQTFTNRKVPYVVKFYPHDDNFFVVGCSDNKIVTYNATTAEITQEYNHHLAPVNAIVFVEENGTKMVTSSDDKKVLVWEWDIGVPIKYISDPTMHSMPCLAMHPSNQFFVGQSLDNTIVVFQAGNRFALQRKKKFSGHVVSGYACEMVFSPDGQFLASGDGNGNLFFWDWKKHKILQKYRAHTAGPTICCAWHPLEPSVMFTCGWDGIIKMWQ